ncbi:MAG: tRNA pseudouridine(38-40) synthase TruA, partial [Acetobacteraceae bacterium]
MPAYALLMEYDGAPFRGWQRQAGIVSVQQALEEAALCLKRGKVSTTVAGRTDAGVHAAGQVVSLALEAAFPVQHLGAALN